MYAAASAEACAKAAAFLASDVQGEAQKEPVEKPFKMLETSPAVRLQKEGHGLAKKTCRYTCDGGSIRTLLQDFLKAHLMFLQHEGPGTLAL